MMPEQLGMPTGGAPGGMQPIPPDQQPEFLKFLQQLRGMSGGAGQAPQGGGQATPGIQGGAPPQVSAGPPQLGGLPQAPGAVAPPVAAAPTRQVDPTQMRSGPYSSKNDRAEAMTSNAIQSLSHFSEKAKARNEAHETARAENYMSQILNAQKLLQANPNDEGAKNTLDLLLTDKKVLKTIEKGMDYYFPKEPGEPAPPEAKGLGAALKKFLGVGQNQGMNTPLPKPNTPGGVAIPTGAPGPLQQAQTQEAIAKAGAGTAVAQATTANKGVDPNQRSAEGSAMSIEKSKETSDMAIERMKIQEQMQAAARKGYKIVSAGAFPIVEDGFGRSFSLADKDAPEDARKMIAGARTNWMSTQTEIERRAANSQAAAMQRAFAQFGERDKIASLKQWQPAFDARRVLGVMQDNSGKAIKGDLQAQKAILSSHINLTFRAAGGRPTQAQYAEAAKAAPLLEQLKGQLIFDKDGNFVDIARSIALTPTQISQMVEMAKTAYGQSYRQANDQTKAFGLPQPDSKFLKPPDDFAGTDSGRVKVKSPDGKIGTLPADQVPAALKSGYTKVP